MQTLSATPIDRIAADETIRNSAYASFFGIDPSPEAPKQTTIAFPDTFRHLEAVSAVDVPDSPYAEITVGAKFDAILGEMDWQEIRYAVGTLPHVSTTVMGFAIVLSENPSMHQTGTCWLPVEHLMEDAGLSWDDIEEIHAGLRASGRFSVKSTGDGWIYAHTDYGIASIAACAEFCRARDNNPLPVAYYVPFDPVQDELAPDTLALLKFVKAAQARLA